LFAALGAGPARATCDHYPGRTGADRQRTRGYLNILDRMRHDGCGGRAGRVELFTGIEGVSSRPGRRIVLVGG
jgi:hypothetical protein